MPKTTIILPNGKTVEAQFVEGEQESDFSGSLVEQYLERTDHFVGSDPTTGRFAIAASAVMIKL